MSAEAGATIDSKQLGAADVSTTSADSRAKEMAATASATNSSSSILSDMKKVFHDTKVDGKSVWTVSMETLTMADGGKWKKNDRIAHTEPEALEIMHEMIRQAKEKCKKNDDKERWDMPWTPLKEFNATVDDILISFCKWAKVDVDDEHGKKEASESGVDAAVVHSVMNVTKAFHRLESYVNWMHDHRDKLKEPLTVESLRPASKYLGMKLSYDKQGCLVWWCDLKDMDLEAIRTRKLSVLEFLRFFVWAMHLIVLDKQAQENGMLIVEDIRKMSFWACMTTFPMEVNTALDRMTIGCLPIKMKACYVMNAATWLHVMMNIMKPFMSKKMRQRIIIIHKNQNAQEIISDVLGGPEFILNGCCGLTGSLEKEIVFGEYFTG